MRSEIALLLLVVATGVACRSDPKHPTGDDVLPKVEGDVVATIDGHEVTAAEASAFAASREEPTSDELVKREQRARRAAAAGVEVELERKRAMVQAFLTDEIERKVGPDDVPQESLAAHRQAVTAELRPRSGFVVTSVRVAAKELLPGRPPVSDERRTQLRGKVQETMDRLYEAVPEENGVEAIESLEFEEWADPALHVELQRDLRIQDADDSRDPVDGWVAAPRLAAELSKLPNGARTEIYDVRDILLFAVRKRRIEPEPVGQARVEEEAMKRALAEVRRKELGEFVERLRQRTPVTMHVDALKEDR